jgi:hypothetical protein
MAQLENTAATTTKGMFYNVLYRQKLESTFLKEFVSFRCDGGFHYVGKHASGAGLLFHEFPDLIVEHFNNCHLGLAISITGMPHLLKGRLSYFVQVLGSVLQALS